MTTFDRPWDDPKWAVKGDDAWTAGCRWLQAWWRNDKGWPAGPRNPGDERLVASMLNEGHDEHDTFFDKVTFHRAEEHLDEIGYGAANDLDQFLRNLLSPRAVVFNLFGPFAREPQQLLPWVQTLDPWATAVDHVRFEWAPKRAAHVPPGAAFDALVVYRADDGRRFVGVEVHYADGATTKAVTSRPPHARMTVESRHWRADAARRLDVPALRRTWLNALLAQSLVDSYDADKPDQPDSFEHGSVAVVACAADTATATATGRVRAEMIDPNYWLAWCPYESVLEALEESAPDGWPAWFRRRYLDFSPVARLLDADDPRVATRQRRNGPDAFAGLLAAGKQLSGEGGVVDELVRGERRLRNEIDVVGLSERAASLAEDLHTLQQAIADASE